MVFLKIGIPLNMNMTYKTTCSSSGCNLYVPYHLKQNSVSNTFTTTEHHFSRNSRFLTIQKVVSKELYWILITTIEHNSTPQKYFEQNSPPRGREGERETLIYTHFLYNLLVFLISISLLAIIYLYNTCTSNLIHHRFEALQCSCSIDSLCLCFMSS